jgi:NSS family neurotransmitter:Na+ symporter
VLADVKPFGHAFFDLFDFLSSNVLLPLGGLAIAVVGGWLVARKDFMGELDKGFAAEPWYDRAVYALVRFVAPALILLIFLNSLGVVRLA